MFRNALLMTWRNLTRNKTFSLINIAGLAVGLATCLLITLYVLNESGYDKNFRDGYRLFRVASVVPNTGESWAALSAPVAQTLAKEVPEVEAAARLLTFPEISRMLVRYQAEGIDKQFNEDNGYYVDSSFLDIMSPDFKYGSPAAAFTRPSTVLLSSDMSERYFGNIDPRGKQLIMNTPFGEKPYTVTGVYHSRKTSHIPARFLLSMRNDDMWQWVSANDRWATNNIFYTYIKIARQAEPAAVLKKIQAVFDRHAGEELKAAGYGKRLYLQAVPDIHLHSNIGNEIAANGNIRYLYMLGSIAAFILLIACINFMNLSSARAEKRAREVGVRKVLGASKSVLVKQFLGESLLLSFLALFLALLLIWLAMPLFNSLAEKDIHVADHPELLAWMLAITTIAGLLAGLYPAFYLSSFRPVAVLKGRFRSHFSAAAIRRGLVVLQFVISVCLIVGAVVIYQQLKHLNSRQLGFKSSQQLVIPLYNNGSAERYAGLRAAISALPSVKAITAGSTYPGIPNINSMLFYAAGKNASDHVDVAMATVESNYLDVLDVKLLQGRNFSMTAAADSNALVVNEAAVQQFGYTVDNAVGRQVLYDFQGTTYHATIVGVVRNFNFESLHHKIRPMAFAKEGFANRYNFLLVQLATNDYGTAVDAVAAAWKKQTNGAPFDYSFIDQDFQRNYLKERQSAKMIAYFTFIAIFIACLGLYGLAAFSAEQRKKEVGVRKVLGASLASVTGLLSREFLQLVGLSLLIATPLAWLAMNRWLQDFEYRITISAWVFVGTGLGVMLIALLATGGLALKAGLSNPVDALRDE